MPTIFLLGPISSILVNKYGSRPIMIIGGCLAGSGLVAASFCNTVEGLYFCVGVIGGTYVHQCNMADPSHCRNQIPMSLFFFLFFVHVFVQFGPHEKAELFN